MADNHGHVVHLFERDCSIQRRHQKIIEEAPAPNLAPTLRQKIAEAACDVARSIQYRGAGTIEFLLDGKQFYFMEMNTRLQVEHPVTEMITGLDLVAWQLKIAANESLPLKQEEIHISGHAIECRIYAEDPNQDFMPSIGQIQFLNEPKGEGLRIDTGVTLHSSITMYYDPMIAKLIAKGQNREEALQRLVQALNHYHVGGVKTNIPFLQAICQHPRFQQAQLSTDFLTKETIELIHPDAHTALLMVIAFDYLTTLNQNADSLLQDSFAWQSNKSSHWISRYQCAEELVEAQIVPLDKNQFKLILNDKEHLIDAQLNGDELSIELEQKRYKATIENQKEQCTLYNEQGQVSIKRYQWGKSDTKALPHKGQLTAPMPSTVVAILKSIGEQVKAGDGLIVLEAMKMEHTIHAPADGILTEIFYSVGAQVNEGAELLCLGT
jgi:3-methylcrotonyl-CoA carboxylase alpha subunit